MGIVNYSTFLQFEEFKTKMVCKKNLKIRKKIKFSLQKPIKIFFKLK